MELTMRGADVSCVALRVANPGVLTRVQSALKAQGVSAEWTPREQLHCTLLTSDAVDDDVAKRLLPGLALPLTFSTEGVKVEAWGEYLVLVLDARPALLRIQTDIFNRGLATGLDISDFTPPAVYKPHITLGMNPGGSLDNLDGFPTDPLYFDEVVVWNGDYRVVDAARLPKQSGDRLFVEVGGLSRRLVARGGPGSGHFGHEGRPGEVGGSLPGDFHSAQHRRVRLTAKERGVIEGVVEEMAQHGEAKLAAPELWTETSHPRSVRDATQTVTLKIKNPWTGTTKTAHRKMMLYSQNVAEYAEALERAGQEAMRDALNKWKPDADFHSAPQARVPHGDPDAEHVVGGKWNPDADLLYHWTDRDGIQGIVDSLLWDAGSLTANPAYRFDTGWGGGTRRWAVVLDRSKVKEEHAPQTVPWEEWEVISKADVDLYPMDPDDSAFVGFGVRTQRDAEQLRNMLAKTYDEDWRGMFPIHLVRNAKPARLTELTERGGPGSGHFGHEGRPGEVGGSLPGDFHSGKTRQAMRLRKHDRTKLQKAVERWGYTKPSLFTTVEHASDYPIVTLFAKNPATGESVAVAVVTGPPSGLAQLEADLTTSGENALAEILPNADDFHAAPDQPVTFKGFHTTFDHPLNFAQRGNGYYIALDRPFFQGPGRFEKVSIRLKPSEILDPRDLLPGMGTDVEKSRKDWSDAFDVGHALSESTPGFDVHGWMDEHVYHKELGYRAEVGEIEPGHPEHGRELVVWFPEDVEHGEALSQDEASRLAKDWWASAEAPDFHYAPRSLVGRSTATADRPPRKEPKKTSDWRTGKRLPDVEVDRASMYLTLDLPPEFVVPDVQTPTDWKPEISNPLDGDKASLTRWLAYNIRAYHEPEAWDLRDLGERAGVINRIPTPAMRERIDWLDAVGGELERTTLGPQVVALSEAVTAAFGGEPIPRPTLVQGDPDATIEVLAKGKTISGVLGQMSLNDWTALGDAEKRALLGEYYMVDAGLETGGLSSMLTDVVRVMYFDMQDILGRHGFERDSTLRLYRGLVERPSDLLPAEMDGGWVNVEISNLSPWTFSPGVAAEYATRQSGRGSLLAMDVPASMVLCNWETGPASRRWLSYLLMASRDPMKAYLYPVQRARLRNG